MERKEITIGYELGKQLIRLCGWEEAAQALKDAGSKHEARGMFRALREQAQGRTLAF